VATSRAAGNLATARSASRSGASTRARSHAPAAARSACLNPLIKLLRKHQGEQDQQRAEAGADWENKGYVFALPTGGPLSPNADYPRVEAAASRRGRAGRAPS
jgi:hypothetical protein